MDTPHERLRWARKRAGYRSAAEAARAMGMTPPTYQGHENGNRAFLTEAVKYSEKFKVSLPWLLAGKGDPTPPPDPFDGLPPAERKELAAFAEFLRRRHTQ